MSNSDYTYSQIKNSSNLYYQYEKPSTYSDGVRTLQSRLLECGYSVTVDGLFGSGTRLAVRRFQQCIYGMNSSHVDGKAGKNTLTQLDTVYNKSAFKYGASLCSTPSNWTRSKLASTTWNSSNKRIDALARVIWGEDNYSNDARAAVARVIYNRANSGNSAFLNTSISNKWLAVLSKASQYGTVPNEAWSCNGGDSFDNWPTDNVGIRVLMPRRGKTTDDYINSVWKKTVDLATALEGGSSITTQPGYSVTVTSSGNITVGSTANANLTSNHMYQIGKDKLLKWAREGKNMRNIITYDRNKNGNYFLTI